MIILQHIHWWSFAAGLVCGLIGHVGFILVLSDD